MAWRAAKARRAGCGAAHPAKDAEVSCEWRSCEWRSGLAAFKRGWGAPQAIALARFAARPRFVVARSAAI